MRLSISFLSFTFRTSSPFWFFRLYVSTHRFVVYNPSCFTRAQLSPVRKSLTGVFFKPLVRSCVSRSPLDGTLFPMGFDPCVETSLQTLTLLPFPVTSPPVSWTTSVQVRLETTSDPLGLSSQGERVVSLYSTPFFGVDSR